MKLPLQTGQLAAEDFGRFLITIFNEWVRNDVARYYVQIFDATLANYVGEMPDCVFLPKHAVMLWLWSITEISFHAIILYILNICLEIFQLLP